MSDEAHHGAASVEQSAAQPVVLRRLKLTAFRNYRYFDIDFSQKSARHIVLTGFNGVGKTNLLEAVSLFSPGRGLRRANYADMINKAAPQEGFVVHGSFISPLYDEVEIGTGVMCDDNSRKVRIDGTATNIDHLTDYVRVIWMVPSQDGLFTGSAGDRRRFLDRMVLAIDPAHARRVSDYEKAMRSRNRLLIEGNRNDALFTALEVQLASLGVAIAAARVELVRLLGSMIERFEDGSPFPKADLALDGELEAQITQAAATDVEEAFTARLAVQRPVDRVAGRTGEGPHRTDFLVFHRLKKMPAALCSTGEQKALLTGIILSHARLTGEISNMTPLLLMDEMVAHLDSSVRAALFNILEFLGVQTFMTGTDRSLFSALEERAQFFNVNDACVDLQS